MKALLKNMSLALLSLFAVLAGAEYALRWSATRVPSDAGPQRVAEDGLMRPDGRFRWVPKEGKRKRFEDPDGRTFWVQINSTGQRGDDIGERRPGDSRALLLGDSFTMATQYPRDSIFVERAGKLLRESGHGEFELINGGVSGYGTYRELSYWHYQGRQTEPDVVVLCLFLGNDFRDNMVSTRQGRGLSPVIVGHRHKFAARVGEPYLRDRQQRALLDPLSGEKIPLHRWGLINDLQERVLLARLVGARSARLWGRLSGDLNVLDLQHRYHFYELGLASSMDSEYLATARDLTRHLLVHLRRSVVDAGAEFMVLTIPSVNQVDPEAWCQVLDELGMAEEDLGEYDRLSVNRLVTGLCDSLDVPYVDVTGDMVAAGDPSRFYLSHTGDQHLSASGHDVVARALAKLLLSSGDRVGRSSREAWRASRESVRRGDLEAAEADLRKALRGSGNWPLLHHDLGEVYLESGQYELAAAAYERAVELDPEYRRAWEGLGEALSRSGDPRGAIDAYGSALALWPEWWPYLERMEELYLELGMTSASELAREALAENIGGSEDMRRQWWHEHISTGARLLQNGYLDKAMVEFGRAIRVAPFEPTGYYNLAMLHERMGERDRAVQLLVESLRIAPDFTPAQVKLSELHDSPK